MNTTAGYHPVSRALHWTVAGMVVLQFVLARLAENAEQTDSTLRQLALLANHKSVGITILALVVIRLLWRRKAPPPALPPTMDQWQVLASRISHWTLYALLLLLPISGWLMSSASAYSVSWFNLLQLPDLVAPNDTLEDTLERIHETLAVTLLIVAGIHVLAAIKHAVIDKDGVLSGMSSTLSITLGALILGAGIWTLGTAGSSSPGAAQPIPTADSHLLDDMSGDVSDGAPVAAAGNSRLPEWQIDYADSYIRFTGDQAGASFDGEWQDWSASMRFDAEQLDDSFFDVTIRTMAVETGDDDRDSTIVGAEWFDTANYPEAHYRTSSFTALGNVGFTAEGQLIVKDSAADVALEFTVQREGERRILMGFARVERLALGLGTGEWEDTTWVSNEVTVSVRVAATVTD